METPTLFIRVHIREIDFAVESVRREGLFDVVWVIIPVYLLAHCETLCVGIAVSQKTLERYISYMSPCVYSNELTGSRHMNSDRKVA